jgi:hypothetical protein
MAVQFIGPKRARREKHCLLGFAASIALIFCIGCSTARVPTAALRNAELDIRSADEARAGEFAAADLKNARDKLARAKQAMAAARYEDAPSCRARPGGRRACRSQSRSPTDAPDRQSNFKENR